MFVLVKDLPSSLRNALEQLGYGRADVNLEIKSECTLQQFAGAGCRAFNAVVNLATGQTKVDYGSWGGPTPFTLSSSSRGHLTDHGDSKVQLDPTIVVIQGEEGGGRPVRASIVVSPASLIHTALPQPKADISSEERKALDIIGGIKSGYRAKYFSEENLGTYGATNPTILSLKAKGLIKVSGVGISITTDGKNVRRAK